jgi:hypothetical protein
MSSATDYVLRVKAGPSRSKLITIQVNDEFNPIIIDNEYFCGYLLVRVLAFNGVTPELDTNTTSEHSPIENPDSGYFNGKNRKYSIMLQGHFKKQWSGEDVIFGVDADTTVFII